MRVNEATSWWPGIRAGLIALAIFFALVEGCPLPPPHETLDWQRGYVSVIRPVQKTILTPIAWLPKSLRITQRFALFQAADAERFRLEVHTRTADGSQRLVFRAGDDGGNYADLLAQRRVRGVWNPTARATRQYPAFTKWFAGVVFDHEPDVQVVTFRMERIRIEDGVPRGLGSYAFEAAHYRGVP